MGLLLCLTHLDSGPVPVSSGQFCSLPPPTRVPSTPHFIWPPWVLGLSPSLPSGRSEPSWPTHGLWLVFTPLPTAGEKDQAAAFHGSDWGREGTQQTCCLLGLKRSVTQPRSWGTSALAPSHPTAETPGNSRIFSVCSAPVTPLEGPHPPRAQRCGIAGW